MAFSSAFTAEQVNIGSGQTIDPMSFDSLNAATFEDGLKIGRFAKLDAGSLDNMDGSATPVIAGVVRRLASNPIGDGDTITSASDGGPNDASYVRNGYVTVEVKAGETPAVFGAVYASNAGDANDGLATATGTDVATNAEFIKEVKTNVWLIRLK